VGGDFYDYVDLPTGRFGFILGDVAGKGSPAALLAAAVLGMFSAEATYQTGAASLITRLNTGLFRRAIESRFLTTFYGMLAPDGSFTYCNAGHNAPLLVSGSEIRRLETGGVVLGLFEHASFEGKPGAEARRSDHRLQRRRHRALDPAGEEYTDDRLLACARAHIGEIRSRSRRVLADVKTFCADATQSDDVTVVMVRSTDRKLVRPVQRFMVLSRRALRRRSHFGAPSKPRARTSLEAERSIGRRIARACSLPAAGAPGSGGRAPASWEARRD
jgi:sigma-B regulation protein RsbU (phosphoserine phosphatase)